MSWRPLHSFADEDVVAHSPADEEVVAANSSSFLPRTLQRFGFGSGSDRGLSGDWSTVVGAGDSGAGTLIAAAAGPEWAQPVCLARMGWEGPAGSELTSTTLGCGTS